MPKQLKPCPFCGESPLVGLENNNTGPGYVECCNKHCNIAPKVKAPSEDLALLLWNRRPDTWIRCEDRMPWVRDASPTGIVMWASPSAVWEGCYTPVRLSATHWQPLRVPDPPEEE